MLDGSTFIVSFHDGTKYTNEEIRNNPILFNAILDGVSNPDYLYTPDSKLGKRIHDYRVWLQDLEQAKADKNRGKQNELTKNAGKLMEEVAYLAFRGLHGCTKALSYQSYADQLDLVVSGEKEWVALQHYLGLKDSPTIVVEGKNIDTPVDVQQFARLCSIVENMFSTTCGLGVFFTRNGATGFPTLRKRVQSLREARATQAIFHARTNKFIVVLSDADIDKLMKLGGLPRLLKYKMQEVEDATGLDLPNPDVWEHVDLPPHLAQHNDH